MILSSNLKIQLELLVVKVAFANVAARNEVAQILCCLAFSVQRFLQRMRWKSIEKNSWNKHVLGAFRKNMLFWNNLSSSTFEKPHFVITILHRLPEVLTFAGLGQASEI